MAACLKIVEGHLRTFKWFRIEQVPRAENIETYNLVRLASGLEDGALGQAQIESLVKPSTKESVNHIMSIDPSTSWIDPFEFLAERKTSEDKMRLEGSGTKPIGTRS